MIMFAHSELTDNIYLLKAKGNLKKTGVNLKKDKMITVYLKSLKIYYI